jgi:hypothetical protein
MGLAPDGKPVKKGKPGGQAAKGGRDSVEMTDREKKAIPDLPDWCFRPLAPGRALEGAVKKRVRKIRALELLAYNLDVALEQRRKELEEDEDDGGQSNRSGHSDQSSPGTGRSKGMSSTRSVNDTFRKKELAELLVPVSNAKMIDALEAHPRPDIGWWDTDSAKNFLGR